MESMKDCTKVESEVDGAGSSYRYWVREVKKGETAVPLPVHQKLNTQDLLQKSLSSSSSTAPLGSVWNSAGTWEEKNLNKWATDRIKALLTSACSMEFSGGKAEISKISKCAGDAFLVTVRNKKRVGYTYELTLKVKGEWTFGEEKKMVKGHLEIPEFSFGELDDLEIEVRLSEDKDLMHQDKHRINQDLKLFLQPVREKLLQFEEELKERKN